MKAGEEQASTPRTALSRRSFTKAAAWSVPVVMVGAAAPAYAATVVVGAAQVRGSCDGTSAAASFTISVDPLPVGSKIQVTLTYTNLTVRPGSFTVTLKDLAFDGTGNGPFTVVGDGNPFSGTINIQFNLGQNGEGRVDATVTGLDGFSVSGDTEGFVRKRRDGNSGNYNQCTDDSST